MQLSRVYVHIYTEPILEEELYINKIQGIELPVRIVIDEEVEITIGIVFIPRCRTKQKKRGRTECLNGISAAFEFGDRLNPIYVLNNTNNLYVMANVCSLTRIAFTSLGATRPEGQFRLTQKLIGCA